MADPVSPVTPVMDNHCAVLVDKEWIKQAINWSVFYGEFASSLRIKIRTKAWIVGANGPIGSEIGAIFSTAFFYTIWCAIKLDGCRRGDFEDQSVPTSLANDFCPHFIS